MVAAVVVSGTCYLLVPIFLSLPRVPEGSTVAVFAAVILVPFLVIGLALRGISDGELCIPCAAQAHTRGTWLVISVAVLWFAVGILFWPSAPLRQERNGYVDKRGTPHGRVSYEAFRRWEATLPLAWLPFALVAITSLPATDRRRKVHYCE